MTFYSLQFKNSNGQVQMAFLLETDSDEAALLEIQDIRSETLTLELLNGERLLTRVQPQRARERVATEASRNIRTPVWHQVSQVLA